MLLSTTVCLSVSLYGGNYDPLCPCEPHSIPAAILLEQTAAVLHIKYFFEYRITHQ